VRREADLGHHSATSLFAFVQFEYPGSLGLADGRYLVRAGAEGDPEHVLVVRTLGAPPRHLLRGRRARPADPGTAPEPLASTRATVVWPQKLDEGGAQSWLDGVCDDADRRDEAVAEALALLNRALHAHRAASADPLVHEVGAERAARIRLGYGSGDGVADGRWTEARELPARPARQRRAVQPQERLAAVLGGRDTVEPAETLILRARLDLDLGRTREAALQLRVGLEALLAQLGDAAAQTDADDRAILDANRRAVGDAANAALRGDLDPKLKRTVRETIEAGERVLRRRQVLG
jgi:hypothetical protein